MNEEPNDDARKLDELKKNLSAAEHNEVRELWISFYRAAMTGVASDAISELNLNKAMKDAEKAADTAVIRVIARWGES